MCKELCILALICQSFGFELKCLDEETADCLALLLRITFTLKRVDELIDGIHAFQIQMIMLGEHINDV